MQSQSDISLCICTSGRPVELERCLTSIAAGSRRPLEVIVSDDSRDLATAQAVREVCSRHDFVRYVEGPRRGLCANRNHVIREARGSHVSLLDDDAAVGADFVERAEALITRYPDKVLTGDVLEDGVRRQSPTNPTFLGHFGRPVRPGDRLENINLNCNVLPLRAFEVASFDESIAYGYEDTDLCAQLLAAGFEIVHVPELVNQHLPPTRQTVTDERHWQAERARFYSTVRRHIRWEPRRRRLLAFCAVAPLHLSMHAVRQGALAQSIAGWRWVVEDLLSGRRRNK